MAIAVIMPRQGQSVESCIITTWNKAVGDTVAEGDVLFSYETDKSAFDEVATVSGTMLAQLYNEGDVVVCLENGGSGYEDAIPVANEVMQALAEEELA